VAWRGGDGAVGLTVGGGDERKKTKCDQGAGPDVTVNDTLAYFIGSFGVTSCISFFHIV